ncbi:hypothetical protein ASPACDRAFT_54641 [Aspergillus aculeatus ATCC 16872]|uniref:Nucleoside phosphorylase domain-containing protein n=1 Tax=Aspergillus aculeatus (strain ATCC 16872 / CBS 172.66 / WB 5094) TaxID=690307 RepID=A0A1L9WJC9_ASPA1|nr:uncharacterized protein ASPACDRAFT_54641 [Aspergillus aculeatus ATCC 16872]OJJ96262.1 hypothetical protein ASPACDRAFT_54641 [Aspergillus aculeatus ATCC 16872]
MTNAYILGAISGHNVVSACLPAGTYGTTSAATVASSMFFSSGSIQHLLMVGIGGGVPSEPNDLRLGDVVVSDTFERTGTLSKPSTSLLAAVTKLRADHYCSGNLIAALVAQMLANRPPMVREFTRPDNEPDRLFHANYEHDPSQRTCANCDAKKLILRSACKDTQPAVHYGLIASENQVIKHAGTRDRLLRTAVLMNNFPCLKIRGISDSADSHNKQ